jgi:heterotetrameric sarcosine oxidase gamma subunit
MLTTESKLPFASPLLYEPIGTELARLEDWSGRLVLDVRGSDCPAGSVGEVVHLDHGLVARLRANRWMYIGLSESREMLPIAELSGGQVVIDVTHAYGILALCGSRVPEVLSQVCALDFADRAFPNCRTAQTSLAKVPALIVRLDETVLILVERSVAMYVWTILSAIVKSTGPVAPK